MAQAAKILIVDDDASTRLVIEATLSRLGYRTRCAGDGRAALAILNAEPFDLVVTDILMPEVDGIELIIALREFHDIPKVVAISGGGFMCGMEILHAAKLLGANVTMQKPLSMSALAKAVAEQLDVRAAEQARSRRNILSFGRAA